MREGERLDNGGLTVRKREREKERERERERDMITTSQSDYRF